MNARLPAAGSRSVLEERDLLETRDKAARSLRDPTIEPRIAVRQYPELLNPYLSLRAAELAASNLKDPEDRKKFVQTVRNLLTDSVARGERTAPVRLRERPPGG